MKKTVFGLLAAIVLCVPAFGQEFNHMLGGGLQYGISNGDVEDQAGIYIYGDMPFFKKLHLRPSLSLASGTYERNEVEGDYTSLGLELAIRYEWPMPDYTPYAGLGAGYYLNDFDNDISVDDKLGVYYLGGILFPIGKDLSIDGSLRYLFLRPDGPEFIEVEMDALILRVGVAYHF